jgi:general secretion pathway protein C
MRAQILRLFWLATLASAACAAYLTARITALVVARNFSVVEAPATGAPTGAAQRRGAELLSDYRIIDDRNLFNVRPPPPPPPPPVVVAPPPPPPPPIPPPLPPPQPPQPPVEPPLDLKLVGTAVVAGGKSYAIIQTVGQTGQEVRVVREKEEIVPGAVLLDVRADKIHVSWKGRTEEFGLYETRTLASAPPPGRRTPGGRAEPPPVVGTPPPPPQQVATTVGTDSVRRTGEFQYTVDKEEVRQLREDPGRMMTQVRVVPNFGEGGQPDGFKVFAIRPGSLFARIGLQNGDVIRRINGVEMQAPDQALEAYQRLKDETTIHIDLVRQNQAKTLTYVIQ